MHNIIIVQSGEKIKGEGQKSFGIVPRFVGKPLSGKKAFIALGLTAEKRPATLDHSERSAGSL